MTTYYTVEKAVTINNGQNWIQLTEQEYRNCLEKDPATTKEEYSILGFERYKNAVMAAKDGLPIDCKEQYPIFAWHFEGHVEKDKFTLEGGTAIEAIRFPLKSATLYSVSLRHASRHFKKVIFSKAIDQDKSQQTVKTTVEVKVDDKQIQPTQTAAIAPVTPVQTKAVELTFWQRTLNKTASFMKRPSFLFGSLATAGTYFGPQYLVSEGLKAYIPSIISPELATAFAVGITAFSTIEVGTGIQHCCRSKASVKKIPSIQPNQTVQPAPRPITPMLLNATQPTQKPVGRTHPNKFAVHAPK